MKKLVSNFMYMTMGAAVSAMLIMGTTAIAQQAPPAAEAEEEEEDTAAPAATTAAPAAEEEEEEAWQVQLPKWSETKLREWKEADSGDFTDAVQSANIGDAAFIGFAKLDGSAPCSDAANCKGWFGSLSEAGRKTALTRLGAALATAFATTGYDKTEVTEMGFSGLVEKIGENRALLAVARLQRDMGMHDGTLYGVAGITDGGKAIRVKQRLERKVDRAAEEVEKLEEVRSDLISAAEKIEETITQTDSAAIRAVREKRHTAAVAKVAAAATKLAAARKKLDKLETELAGGPPPDPNAPALGGGAQGSGTVN